MQNRSIQKLTKLVVDQMLQRERQKALPPNEEIKIEQAIAVDHLYYSSALEGIMLSADQLQRAIYGGSTS